MPEEFVEDILKEPAEPTKDVTKDGEATKQEDDPKKAEAEDQDVKVTEQEAAKDADKEDDKAAQEAKDADEVTDAAGGKKAVETLAEQLGWNKDHQGPEKVDAATYILRSREIQDTMRDHNKDLKNQVGTLHESVKALQEHNENVFKAEINRLESELKQLKKAKREAVELADVNKVDEIDEQIESIQKNLNKPEKESSREATNPVYDEWVKDNQWYENDDEMAVFADTVAEQYKGAPLERVYKIVRQKVQEVFPEKFEQPKQEEKPKEPDDKKPVGPASPVEKGTNKGGESQSFSVNDLTAEQKSTMNQFVKMGIMTEKQYVTDIAKMQEG